MSYGDFSAQIKERGALAITRIAAEKTTHFQFEGQHWICTDKNRAVMTNELASGYEMGYCLGLYCESAPVSSR